MPNILLTKFLKIPKKIKTIFVQNKVAANLIISANLIFLSLFLIIFSNIVTTSVKLIIILGSIYICIFSNFDLIKKFFNFTRTSTQKFRSYIAQREVLADIFLVTGSGLIFFYFCSILTITLTFILKGSIEKYHLILNILLSITFLGIIVVRKFKLYGLQIYVLSLVIIMVITVCFGFLSSRLYDNSVDGMNYHQESLIQLAIGYNPFYEKTGNIQIDHYTKAPWLIETSLYKITDTIEIAKVFKSYLLFASFFVIASALLNLTSLSIKKILAISIIVAFNPISLVQSLSFVVDGQLSSLIMIFLGLFAHLHKRYSRFVLLLLGMTAVVAINVKFTAIPFLGIYGSAILFIFWGQRRFREFLIISSLLAFAFAVGFLFIGYNPYIINLEEKGSPFFPAAGKDAYILANITQDNMPHEFQNMNRFEKLYYSVFSETEDLFGAGSSVSLKVPFELSKDEFQYVNSDNTRVGAFGPLFSGAVVIAAFILILLSFEDKKAMLFTAYFITVTLVSTLIISEAWWLRFVPQLFLVVIFPLIPALTSKKSYLNFLGNFLIIILLFNLYLMGSLYIRAQSDTTDYLNTRIEDIKLADRPVKVYFSYFRGNRTKFAENGIPFVEVPEKEVTSCRDWRRLIYGVVFCVRN